MPIEWPYAGFLFHLKLMPSSERHYKYSAVLEVILAQGYPTSGVIVLEKRMPVILLETLPY